MPPGRGTPWRLRGMIAGWRLGESQQDRPGSLRGICFCRLVSHQSFVIYSSMAATDFSEDFGKRQTNKTQNKTTPQN